MLRGQLSTRQSVYQLAVPRGPSVPLWVTPAPRPASPSSFLPLQSCLFWAFQTNALV